MGSTDKTAWGSELLRHPLIRRIGELTADVTSVRLLIVYPTERGWGQLLGDSRAERQPQFCKLIQDTGDGGRHCRMCHILMTIAACSGGPTVQRCHAGARVLVCPAADESARAVAVVSSCMFAETKDWDETAERGKTLGADLSKLRKAFLDLPRIDARQRAILQACMKTMSEALQNIWKMSNMEKRLQLLNRTAPAEGTLEGFLKHTDWARNSVAGKPGARPGAPPRLIRVVCELVRQRPDLPLTVKELAAAARVTPNHFTTVFGQWVGQSFVDYLTAHRIERAKKMLDDLTLNINEIGRLVGYDDPGYFTRRFHRQTGLSPSQWRDRDAQPRAARKTPRRPKQGKRRSQRPDPQSEES